MIVANYLKNLFRRAASGAFLDYGFEKREAYRQAFFQFDPERIAQMTESDIDQLMQNTGLIRHRAKLEAIVKNAKAYLTMQANGEDFSRFIWAFVGGKPQINDVPDLSVVPAKTEVSAAMSKALKRKVLYLSAKPLVTLLCNRWDWLMIT
ncbi:DNA-3-methyladenine glycosidase I [Actinobacillus equuli]|nr:DNA-3-methyladenine glycosidase I [Actinobacillus equuli]